MSDSSEDILNALFGQTKLQYIESLENRLTDSILDMQDNVILPNLKLMKPSQSLFLREDIFSKYLDKIMYDAFQNPKNQTCPIKSVFYTDYFITIDFIDFLYKIPNILLSSITKCKSNPNIRFYVIPIRLNLTYKSAHSNVIIIDNSEGTIEFFEPHGSMFQGFNVPKPYNIENHIKTLVSRLFPLRSQLYKYKNVQNNCPMGLGLQSKQNIINPKSGHCLAWSLLFIHVRILNLFLHPDDVINYFTGKFTPTELDRYMRRYIALLENTTLYSQGKTLPNFKYHLLLTQQERYNISNRITTLTEQYLLESSTTKNREVINEIFEELISYHKYPRFNDIFFSIVNKFIEEFKYIPEQVESIFGTDIFDSSKRKLSPTTEEPRESKLSKTQVSPLTLLFGESENPTSDITSDTISDTTSNTSDTKIEKTNSESTSESESEPESESESESDNNSDDEELDELYERFH